MSRLGSALLGSNEYARPLICPPMEKTSGKPTRLDRVCISAAGDLALRWPFCARMHTDWVHIARVNPAGSQSRI